MSLMSDKTLYKSIAFVPAVDWTTNTEYVHNTYKWIISPLSTTGSFECKTYNNKKIIRENLVLNEQLDESSSSSKAVYAEWNNIYNQTITSIPRCMIVQNDIVFVPIGTTWAQVIADDHIKAVVPSFYNNIVKIAIQCTFNCNITLPVGLPLFNASLDRVVGFVGRRLPNGRYVIDAAASQKISRHILSDEKIAVKFMNIVNSPKDGGEVVTSRKRVNLYGNKVFDKGLATYKLRQLETTFNDNECCKQINIAQMEDGVFITITNGNHEDAAEVESFSFVNTKLDKYYVLPPIHEFVVEEVELDQTWKRKKKR